MRKGGSMGNFDDSSKIECPYCKTTHDLEYSYEPEEEIEIECDCGEIFTVIPYALWRFTTMCGTGEEKHHTWKPILRENKPDITMVGVVKKVYCECQNCEETDWVSIKYTDLPEDIPVNYE